MVLARPFAGDLPIVLASPVTGSVQRVTALEAVAIRLLTEIAPAVRDAWIADHFGARGLKMTAGDREIDDPVARQTMVRDAFLAVRVRLLPKLVELGILEPAA